LTPQLIDGGIRVEVEHGETFVPQLLRTLPVAVQSVQIDNPTLNDVFLRLTGRTIRDDAADNLDRLRSAMRRRGRKGA
jgi:ABC-2 type transport system ATP-binding protein